MYEYTLVILFMFAVHYTMLFMLYTLFVSKLAAWHILPAGGVRCLPLHIGIDTRDW